MTREQEVRLRAALEGAFVCDAKKIRIDETRDPFRVTRAVLTALLYEEGVEQWQDIENEVAALRERGGRCDDAEVLLNCRLGAGELQKERMA